MMDKTRDGIEFSDLTENPWVMCDDDMVRQCDSYTIQVNCDAEYFHKKWSVEYFTSLSCGCCSDNVVDRYPMEEVYSTEAMAIRGSKIEKSWND